MYMYIIYSAFIAKYTVHYTPTLPHIIILYMIYMYMHYLTPYMYILL